MDIGLEDFSKINVLLKHAQFHQDTYGDSFVDFLNEHYGSNENQAPNHKEHKDLPFKQDSITHNHLPSVFTLETQLFEVPKSIAVQVSENYFYKESYSLFEKISIFQPPKFS
jgi:PHP family Zn ribbon phosphoesterase